jgi:hypothetical protein
LVLKKKFFLETGKTPGQNIVLSAGITKYNISTVFDQMFQIESVRWNYGTGKFKLFFLKLNMF